MMERAKRMALRLLQPGIVVTVVLVVVSTALLAYCFASEQDDTVAAYTAYILSAWALAVVVAALVEWVPKVRSLMLGHPLGNRFASDVSFRARVSLRIASVVDILYALLTLVFSWMYLSPWYGAVAGFYIVLSLESLHLLRSVRAARVQEDSTARRLHELRSYRFCGYLMFLLSVVMTGVIYQVVLQSEGTAYPGFAIYAAAAFSFTCLTLAIVNIIRFRELTEPILSAAKMLGLAKALMSLFFLETAMLALFSGSDEITFRLVMSIASGGAFCAAVFAMAIYMVLRANRELREDPCAQSGASANNSQT